MYEHSDYLREQAAKYLELAKKEEILIPSCTGAYVPFEIVREKLGTR